MKSSRPNYGAIVRRRSSSKKIAPNVVSFATDTLPDELSYARTGKMSVRTSADLQSWAAVAADTWARHRSTDGVKRFFVCPGYSNHVIASEDAVANGGSGRWHLTAPGIVTGGQATPDGLNNRVRYQNAINNNSLYEGPNAESGPGGTLLPNNTYQLELMDGPTGNGTNLCLMGYGDVPLESSGLSKTVERGDVFIDTRGSTFTGAHQNYIEISTGEASNAYGGGGTFPSAARDVYIRYLRLVVSQRIEWHIPWTSTFNTSADGMGAIQVGVTTHKVLDSNGYFHGLFDEFVPAIRAAWVTSDYYLWAYDANNHLRFRQSDSKFVLTLGGTARAVSAAQTYLAGDKLTIEWWNDSTSCGVAINGVKTTGAAQPAITGARPDMHFLLQDASAANQPWAFVGGVGVTFSVSRGAHWLNPPPPLVVFLGDSTTAGNNNTPGADPPSDFRNVVGAKASLVDNMGQGFDTTGGMQSRFVTKYGGTKRARALRHLVVYSGGINDLRGGAAVVDIVAQIRATMIYAKSLGFWTIHWTLMPGVSLAGVPADYEAARLQVDSLCESGNADVTDAIIRTELNAKVGVPGANLGAYFTADHLHPNDAGSAVIALEMVLPVARVLSPTLA